MIRWAMRKSGVEEWLMSAVMAMYLGANTVIRTAYDNTEGIEVNVAMRQWSRLLFVIAICRMQMIW